MHVRMRPTDGMVCLKEKKKKAALLRFKFSNPLTEALKADCLKRKLAAPSSEEPWSSDVLLVSAQQHMSRGRVKDVQRHTISVNMSPKIFLWLTTIMILNAGSVLKNTLGLGIKTTM